MRGSHYVITPVTDGGNKYTFNTVRSKESQTRNISESDIISNAGVICV